MKFAVRGMGCLWGVALLLAGLSACGSSSTKCTTNCKADAAVDVVTPVDHPVDDGAGARDALVDGAGDAKEPKGPIDGAVACDHSIAEACAATADAGAFTFHCAATWGATTSTAYFCGRPQTTVLTETCGTDRELIDTNGSDEYIYVYDSSGKLYAISYSANGSSHCIAGPEAFVAPNCSSQAGLFSCHPDGAAH
jgi:hypothetical protein